MRAPARLTEQLTEKFRQISLLLYDTNVASSELEAEVFPFMDPRVRFVDPWQEGTGLANYRDGAAGFHCMLRFDLVISQVGVQLDLGTKRGRAIVDGVMNLKQLSFLYTYRLRTLLTYEFTLTSEGDSERAPGFLIQTHEEMWSLGDMIAAVPAAGWVYQRLFRPAFSQGFLAASSLCRRLKAGS